MTQIQDAEMRGDDDPVAAILAFPDVIAGFSAENVSEAAQRLLDPENYVRLTQMPEPGSPAAGAGGVDIR